MEKKVRVRFAPSPTGPLHMGGVRTALYNYLFARQQGGDFVLRIEDTDQNRYVPGAEEYIVEALRWCGISPNEGYAAADDHSGSEIREGGQATSGASDANERSFGPYRQSERKEIYRSYAEQLVEQGAAYYAFDTAEELEAMRQRLKEEKSAVQQYGPLTRDGMQNSLSLPAEEVRKRIEKGDPYVIRVKMPAGEEIRFQDIIRGEVSVQSDTLDDKVLFKSDGLPTYHLANVVDDHLMQISHVIRGEEWLPSTPLHTLLYRLLNWEAPHFAHLPLLLKPDGKGKLSKRDGDRLGFPVFPLEWTDPNSGESSSGYREKGFLPEAFVNMLALLGWTSEGDQEILSLEAMAHAFQLEKVHKAGSKYNYEKALWFNGQYLQEKNNDELTALFRPLLAEKVPQSAALNDDFLKEVLGLIKERCSLVSDLWEQSWFFFKRPESYDTASVQKKWDEGKVAFFDKVIALFEEGTDAPGAAVSQAGSVDPARHHSTEQEMEQQFKALMQTEGMKPGEVMLPLRIMLTGGKFGPSVFAITALLGRQESIERIRLAVPEFNS